MPSSMSGSLSTHRMCSPTIEEAGALRTFDGLPASGRASASGTMTSKIEPWPAVERILTS